MCGPGLQSPTRPSASLRTHPALLAVAAPWLRLVGEESTSTGPRPGPPALGAGPWPGAILIDHGGACVLHGAVCSQRASICCDSQTHDACSERTPSRPGANCREAAASPGEAGRQRGTEAF